MAFVVAEARVARRNVWVFASLVVAAALLAFHFAAATNALLPGQKLEPFEALSMWGAAAAFVGAILTWAGAAARHESGRLVADERGLSLDGRTILADEEIEDAHVIPRHKGAPAVLVNGRNALATRWVPVASVDEGGALLRALRRDAGHAVATFSGPPPDSSPAQRRFELGGGMACLALGVLGWLAFSSSAALLAVPLAIVAAKALGPGATRVTVGADGVRVSARRTAARYWSFANIVAVAAEKRGARITLANGEHVDILMKEKREALDTETRDALVQRIREGLAAYRATDRSARLETLARGGRPAGEWIEALAKLRVTEAVTYRSSAPSTDDLWNVLEDPAADKELRAAAAMTLAPALDDEGRKRVRVAAAATASPHLRVALESATEADESPDLEEALDALRDEQRRS